MNKKKINIVLIIAVLAIWGILIYRFVGGHFFTDAPEISFQPTAINGQPIFTKKEKHDIAIHERDPFLSKHDYIRYNYPSNSGAKQSNNPNNKVDNSKAPVQWPNIKYLGFVKQKKSRRPLILLQINNKFYRKRPNENLIGGVKIMKFYNDSIKLKLKGEIKVISKN